MFVNQNLSTKSLVKTNLKLNFRNHLVKMHVRWLWKICPNEQHSKSKSVHGAIPWVYISTAKPSFGCLFASPSFDTITGELQRGPQQHKLLTRISCRFYCLIKCLRRKFYCHTFSYLSCGEHIPDSRVISMNKGRGTFHLQIEICTCVLDLCIPPPKLFLLIIFCGLPSLATVDEYLYNTNVIKACTHDPTVTQSK